MSNIVKKRKLLRDKITKYLSNDKSNFEDFKSYLIDNDFILSEINNEKFDILTFTIENIKYENESTYSLIKFIYDEFEYKNINYTIVIKDIPKTPLFSAIVRDKLNIADYLISLKAKIYYINSKNLNIFEYINEYYLEKKVNGRIINFIFNKLNKIENDKNKKAFIIEMCLNVKYSIFKLIPNFVEKKKFNMLKNIFQCYSINNFNEYTSHKCLIDLLMAYKKKTPLSDEKILTYSDQIPIYFEISPISYEKVIETLDENTIIKNKLKYNKTVNYKMLKFLLSYEINKNQAILIKINRTSIYEAIITDNRYNLKLDKKLNIFKELLEIDSDFNHYEIFEKNLNLLKYSNKYFLITIIMNIIKENKILISKIKFYEIIIEYIKISNLLGIEEIMKSLLFFENVVLSEDKVNDIIIKLIEYFYKDEKNQNLKSFYRILNILFESRTFNSNIDFENIIKECIKKKKIYLINKIIISMKKYLAKEIIKNIDFGKILLELIKNPDITYDVFQNFWVLIFHSKEINLSQFNFDEIIINALGNNIIGKKIIQGILANLINFDQNNYLVSIECTIMNLYEKNKINENYFKIITGILKINKNKNENKNLSQCINKKGKTNVVNKFNNLKVKDNSLNIYKINTEISSNKQLDINNNNNNNNNKNYNRNNNNINSNNNNSINYNNNNTYNNYNNNINNTIQHNFEIYDNTIDNNILNKKNNNKPINILNKTDIENREKVIFSYKSTDLKIELKNENRTIIDLTNEDNNTKDLTTENTKTINLSNESDNIIDLTKEDKYIIDLTDENSINKYELTNKNNSMNNSNCINDSFKNIKSNNENKINSTFCFKYRDPYLNELHNNKKSSNENKLNKRFCFHYRNIHLNESDGNNNNYNNNSIDNIKNINTNTNTKSNNNSNNNYDNNLTKISDFNNNLNGIKQSNDFNDISNKIKKTKINTCHGNISLNDESKNNKYKYFSKEVSLNKFNEGTRENLNLLFIKSIKNKDIDLLKKLLKNDKLKNIEINNKIGNEYPLVIAFNNCISGNNNGVYEKIYNDLNYYNYKEKEIAIFKTLLEYGADLNIKINNKNTILEESMEKNLHLINKVIFDFLIKENKREEREKEKTFNMKKLEKRKDRNRYNNYIQKEEPYYRKHNKNIFTNKKYILNNKYEKESIDLLNKNNIKRHNYTNDKMVIHQRKRNREVSEEIYNEKAKKYKYDKIIKNRTLKYIENKFTPLVSDYLFKKNFDIKKWIDSDNVNGEDNYDYTIIYYALLKEDREAIKYIIKIGSNNMISTSIFKHQTIIHVSVFLGLKDIFLDIIQGGQKILETVNHEEDNTGLFKSIVLNDHFSLYDKKKVINDLCSYIEINKIKIYRNPLVNLMNMKSEDNACKLASFLLKKTNLKVDNTFKDIFKNSLEFAIEYNLYNFVKLLLKKTFRRNYHNFYKALKSAIVKAIKVKNIKILELLLGEFKGNINWFNSLGECPIKLAVDSNDLNMVKLLVERKCNIEDKIIYSRKYSILYYSLTKNDSNVDIIKYFISLEAKMNIENENEFEKLFRRLDNTGKISLLKYFVNCKEKEFMEKFLKYTITFNRLDILKILFENNFNPEQKIEKRTLWKFARNLNNSKLFLYLKRKRQEFVLKNRKNKELRRKKRRLRKKKKQAKKKLNSLNLKENKLIK